VSFVVSGDDLVLGGLLSLSDDGADVVVRSGGVFEGAVVVARCAVGEGRMAVAPRCRGANTNMPHMNAKAKANRARLPARPEDVVEELVGVSVVGINLKL
jgi:hypothetical protein